MSLEWIHESSPCRDGGKVGIVGNGDMLPYGRRDTSP